MSVYPIFYINLAHRTDRDQFMREQMETLDLSATRIEATTPETTPSEEWERSAGTLRRNELACLLSHETAWAAILSTGASHGVVLEDDAVLSPQFPQFLSTVDLDGIDLLRFEKVGKARVLPPFQSHPAFAVRRFRSTPSGSSGYILSRTGAQAMIGATRSLPVDVALFNPLQDPGRKLRPALVDPAFCQQANTDNAGGIATSDVQKNADDPDPKRRWDPAAKLINALDHIWHLPQGLEQKPIAFTS